MGKYSTNKTLCVILTRHSSPDMISQFMADKLKSICKNIAVKGNIPVLMPSEYKDYSKEYFGASYEKTVIRYLNERQIAQLDSLTPNNCPYITIDIAFSWKDVRFQYVNHAMKRKINDNFETKPELKFFMEAWNESEEKTPFKFIKKGYEYEFRLEHLINRLNKPKKIIKEY